VKRIIVEGMDGSGKTTLINDLMERFHYLVCTVNVKGPDQDFNTWWRAQLNSSRGPYMQIHDRFFYSELVYGPVLRGYVNASTEVLHDVRTQLQANAMLIFCRPRYQRKPTGPQMEGVVAHHRELKEAYDTLMQEERTFYPAGRFQVYDFMDVKALQRIEAAVEGYLSEPDASSLSASEPRSRGWNF
jgi:hypothetical protein